MHRYRAFGLSIASEIKLDELTPDPASTLDADLEIRVEELGYEIKGMGEAPPQFHYDDPRGFTSVWPGVAAYRVASPSLIELELHNGCPNDLVPFPLLGATFGWMLHLRGLLVLHASALKFGDKSFGFLGDKMAGKSTTAAAFLKSGGSLLTDDLLAFDMTNHESPMIQPAFAQIKLSDEASESIAVPGWEKMPAVVDALEKKRHKLDDMHREVAPCDALFTLRRGGEVPRLKWLTGMDALAHVMRYSYSVRFHDAPPQMREEARHFQQCGHLSKAVRIGELHVPSDLGRLNEVVDLVLQALEE